jgi:hypothetical protein
MGLRRLGRRLSRGFRRVTSFARKAVGTVLKPFAQLTTAFTQVIGRALDFVPFGGLIKQFGLAFMGSPLALLAPGTLGATFGLFGMARSTQDLAGLTVSLASSTAAQRPEARANVYAMAAWRHAQLAFPYVQR